MPAYRITVRKLPDRADELRIAAKARSAIWAHSPVEIDPDHPLHGTHRDTEGRAYFEFYTEYPTAIEPALRKGNVADLVEFAERTDLPGEACVNCGNVAGLILPPECPTCGFVDVSPCPYCDHHVARQQYMPSPTGLHRCPQCQRLVRLRFHDPLFTPDGTYNQPLVIVERGEMGNVPSLAGGTLDYPAKDVVSSGTQGSHPPHS